MHLRSATSRDGRTFTRTETGGFIEQRSNAGLHPFFRASDFDTSMAGAKLTQPYAKSAWVSAAIDLLTGPIKSVPLRFALDGRGSKTLLSDPTLDEFWAKPAVAPVRPALLQTAISLDPARLPLSAVIDATVGWLKLKGEAFWIFDDTWLRRTALKREPFLIARPDRMREVVREGQLLGWQFRDGAGRMWPVIPEQVLHIKRWNPYHDVRGLAPYEAAHTPAEADYLAGEYGRNLMRNNGDRGPIISSKGGMLSDEQQEQMIRMLREKRAAAARGDFRPAFLSGEVSVEDPKSQNLDAALIAQRLENRDEVAIALGVPPSMFHVKAAYSIGSASDYFRMIETGCMPLAAQLADAVEAVSAIMTGRSIFAWWDFSQHSTMQQIRSERIDKDAKTLWSMGMPFEKINEALGLGLPSFEGAEIGYLPYNVTTTSGAEAEAEPDLALPEGGDQAEPQDDVQKAFSGLATLLQGRTLALDQTTQIGARTPLARKGLDAKSAARWRAHFRRQLAAEKRCLGKITKVLFAARKEVLRKLAMHEQATRTLESKAVASDFIFNLQTFTKGMKAEIRKSSRLAMDEAGQEVFDDLQLDDPWSMPEPAALAFLDQRENMIADASAEIHRQITGTLQQGLEAGDTMAELAGRVKDAFKGIEDGRAQTIASTETGVAMGVGRQRAMEVASVEWKEWLTSGLDNVRATHQEANGQIVPTEEPFAVGAAKLMHPGDPTGPAEEVINCRCVAIATTAPAEDPENSDT